jgi:hypothetical protein
MKKDIKTVGLYGIITSNSDKKHRFDDSKLFQKNSQFAVLLKSIKIYFGNNINNHKTLVGLEASYINYINSEKIKGEFHGVDNLADEVEVKELVMEGNDYIKNFEFNFDENFDYINYIKIITSKGKDIEFGERGEKIETILNYNGDGDNMIQFFWGDYDEEGINAISFKYINRKQFIFGTRIPILYLRNKIFHNEDFKKKCGEMQESLKHNKSMIYLYRTCLLPNTIFAKIIKYC